MDLLPRQRKPGACLANRDGTLIEAGRDRVQHFRMVTPSAYRER